MNRAEAYAIPPNGNVALRENKVEPLKTALLLVDLQNMEFRPGTRDQKDSYYYDRIENLVIPNNKRLLTACRETGIEPIFTVIESLTLDGRDRSLDHKISGIFVAKGSWEAQVIPDLAPRDNEILIPKTASGIFFPFITSTSALCAESCLRLPPLTRITSLGIIFFIN